MKAKLEINGTPVQVDDYTLADLNKVLAQMPWMKRDYKGNEYIYTADASKHLRLEAVFVLQSVID